MRSEAKAEDEVQGYLMSPGKPPTFFFFLICKLFG